ncbi:hypothetical protein Tsp_05573 [Trichinella spiralis]|uniref:hypothetical protein n=1 Tax=Trichinella spiralis TaxID=6334 RepID=UPI0001EFDF8B|nr:hypothetical protein Tsp_05573 [Trichinella spiralis]
MINIIFTAGNFCAAVSYWSSKALYYWAYVSISYWFLLTNYSFNQTLPLVQTATNEQELIHFYDIVGGWKAIYNATYAESLAGWLPLARNKKRDIATTFVTYRQQKAENTEDKDDSVILFQGLSRRLAVARTKKLPKQSFQVVSRWKPVYNETPAEFIPEEGKTRRCIPLKINQMFSITRGNISLVSVCQTERETDFIYCYTTSHFFIISLHILVVLELHALETIVILSLVAMETAAIFPYSLQVLQFLFIDRLQCSKSFDAK